MLRIDDERCVGAAIAVGVVVLEGCGKIRTRKGFVRINGKFEYDENVVSTGEPYEWSALTVSYER